MSLNSVRRPYRPAGKGLDRDGRLNLLLVSGAASLPRLEEPAAPEIAIDARHSNT
ncbi:hypothetical protein [Paractinoplanes toevensis]|uniref:hypothetical protein n=1 Tax=Paractinoplanes toevensis TaxID=571911 RepID=UPI001BB3B7F3|nr:hypothetical protein [Actinoplanes toevensis]